MELLWLYLLSFIVFPILGEIKIWYRGLSVSAGDVEPVLIIGHVLYAIIEIAIAYGIQKYNYNERLSPLKLPLPLATRTINRSIMLLGLALVVVYMLSGYKILYGIAGRGEIRVFLMQRHLGIIYSWLIHYLTPGILIVNSIIYRQWNHKVQRQLRTKLLLLYCLAVLIGILTGYKASFLLIIMGGVAVLTHGKLTLKRLLLLVLVSVVGLTGMTAFVQKMDMIPAINFLIHRMTIMSAYGTIGVWNTFSDGASSENLILYALSTFGNHLASMISGHSVSSVDFLPINPSRLVTYLVYGDPFGAARGTVNVTITNFGEAVYVFGRRLFFVHAIVAGLILGISIRAFRISVIQGKVMKSMLWGVYFFNVVIPWVNGGGIWNLIGMPAIVWLFGTYIVIKLIIRVRIGFVSFGLQQSSRSSEAGR